MLYADKAALESRTKLLLLAIRERELTLYTQNCFTIGTVGALMAGLAYSSLLYTKFDYFQDATPFVQSMYLLGNVVSMYLALRAMTGTTMIAMFGPGKALRGPDGSMHETVDSMLEEFEKAGISFQGCLYSFVFCLLAYAWSGYQAAQTPLCVLTLTSMALVTAYCMLARTKEVETTFPLYSIPLVSGAFFNKKAASGAPGGVLDPAASLRAELGAEAHAEQQRLVAEARARAVERKAVDKEAGETRRKDGKWFTRLRDR